MQEKELELVNEICREYNISEEMFKQLIDIEKDYANRNMSRRAGIFDRLTEVIDSHA